MNIGQSGISSGSEWMNRNNNFDYKNKSGGASGFGNENGIGNKFGHDKNKRSAKSETGR